MTRKYSCPDCGARLEDDASTCPRCLLELGLLEGEVGSEDETLLDFDEDERLIVGQSIGSYELLEIVGEGGMGVVYLAQQSEPIERRVALKVVKLGMDSREVIARFEAERQALARLSHPNIASVLDAGTTPEGRPYFVMEYVPGSPLTEYCDQHRLSARGRLDLFSKVCEAIHHAHQRGLIHRDIKPSNILVTEIDQRPEPKVIDFGVAKAIERPLTEKTLFTQEGLMIGTPAYMSPEQAEGGLDIDITTDVYSLGVVLYELLSGCLPFEPRRLRRAGFGEMLRIIREEDPAKPSTRLSGLGETVSDIAESRQTNPMSLQRQLRGDLDWITLKALEKDRTRRYRAVTELAADIARHLAHQPVAAGPPSLVYRTRKMVRRHTVLVMSLLAVFLAVMGGAVVSTIQYMRAEVARRESRRQLINLEVSSGMYRVRAGDLLSSLPFLTRALIHEEDEGQREAHSRRIAAVLEQSPKLIHFWLHEGRLTATAISPDGTLMATASEDGTAQVRRLPSGELIAGPFTHPGGIWHVAFSFDGALLVTAGDDGTARIWDLKRSELAVEPIHHDGPVYHAEFSADSTLVATASGDDSARVWEVATGAPTAPPLRHRDEVWSVSFSPDDRYVVTASADATGQVWNAKTGEPVGRPLRHVSNLFTAQFSPDGKTVATASSDGSAKLWDLATGDAEQHILKHPNPVYSVAFSPDGTKVATASLDYSARIWNAASGEPLTPPLPHEGSVLEVEFSRDGRRLLTASDDGFARVWDASTGALAAPPLPHARGLTTARLDPSGRFVLTGCDDHGARLWDLATTAPRSPSMRHPTLVYSTGLSSDGNFVVTSSRGRNYARVWDTRTGEPVTPRMWHVAQIWGASFSPDGRQIAVVDEAGAARMWDALSGEPLTDRFCHPMPLLAVAFSPDGSRIATGGGDFRTDPKRRSCNGEVMDGELAGLVQVWDVAGEGSLTPLIRFESPVGYVEFSPDGRRLLTSGHPWLPVGNLGLLDSETGETISNGIPEKEKVVHATFSPAGDRIAVASHEGTVRIWDEVAREPLTAALPHGGVVFTAFSPEGDRLLSCGADSTARIWDLSSGKAELAIPPLEHQGTVWQASFSADGRWVATASGDGTARVWDAQTGQPVSPPLEHGSKVQGAVFTPNGAELLTWGWDGATRVWNLPRDQRPSRDLELLAELVSGRYLNETGALLPLGTPRLEGNWMTLSSADPETLSLEDSRTRSWNWYEAESLIEERQWAESLLHLARLESTDFPIWLRRNAQGQALAELGRFSEAEREFAGALDERPDQPEHWFYLGMSRLGRGDQEGLDRICSQMLAKFSGTQNPDRAFWTASTCVVASALENPEQVRDLARQRQEVENIYSDGFATLGAALVRAGEFSAAADMLQMALDARRGWKGPREWLWMSLAQVHLGRREEAERWRAQAVERLKCSSESGGSAPTECWVPWYRRVEAESLLDIVEAEVK